MTLKTANPHNDTIATKIGKPIRNILYRCQTLIQNNIKALASTIRTGNPRHNHGNHKITVKHEAIKLTAAKNTIW
ncbi:MAG: hypothetical protein AB8W37_07715 [Arsenophonus endosymbiont of Dermacentor nuttalli]